MIWKLVTAVLLVGLVALAALAVRHLREAPPVSPSVVRAQLAVPADMALGSGTGVLDAAISPALGDLVIALVGLALVLALARFLYRRQIFLRI